MTNKEQIVGISQDVSDLLSQYVAIHDDIFKTSIRHAIPIPGIFKAIDFGSHLSKIESIVPELDDCASKIKSLVENANGQEREYLVLLSQFIGALIETVSRLKIVVGALYAKSKSFVNSNYDWKDYKNDLSNYEQSVQNYTAIGEHLNELFEKVEACQQTAANQTPSTDTKSDANEYHAGAAAAAVFGKGNSPEILVKKAKALAPLLLAMAVYKSENLFEILASNPQALSYQKIDSSKYGETVREFIFFLYHYVDRVASIKLNTEQQKHFTEALFIDLATFLLKAQGNSSQFRDEVVHKYVEREFEYTKYKLYPEKEEEGAGTLFYKFGLNIAQIFDCQPLGEDGYPDAGIKPSSHLALQVIVLQFIISEIRNSLSKLELFELLSE